MKNRPLQPYSPAVLLSLALLVSTGSLAASQGFISAWATAPLPPTARCVSMLPEEPDEPTHQGAGWMESISRAARQFHGLQHQLLSILHGDSSRHAPLPLPTEVLPLPESPQASSLCLVRENLLNLPPPVQV